MPMNKATYEKDVTVSTANANGFADGVRASEIRYRRIFETAREGILILDAKTRKITDANPFMVDLLGYSVDEFIGKELWEIGLLADKEASKTAFRELQEHRYIRYEDMPLETKGGIRREIEFVSQVYDGDGASFIQCNVVDITQRKQVEGAAMRLAALVKSSDDAIISKTLSGEITSWNPAAETMFGYTPEEAIGQQVTILFPPELVDEETEILAEVAQGDLIKHFDTIRLRKDGTRIDVSVTISPVTDKDGKIIGASKIARDITDRRAAEAEVQRLNSELEKRVIERTAQLESANKELEAFSYSVSHDLRAPLRHINGFSQALLEDYGDKFDDEGKGYLRELHGASQEMAQLIEDILHLARVSRSEMRHESINLSTLADEVVSDLRKLEAGRKVKVIIAKGLLSNGDYRLLKIVLTNLIGNAWKFTSRRDDAQIEFGKQTVGDETVFFVRDNGAGFDMRYVDKLFGVFQRLHTTEEFEGTGIGLATVQRIIRRHNGRIWPESMVGEGTTFYFTLSVDP